MKRTKKKKIKRTAPQGNHNTNIQINLSPPDNPMMTVANEADYFLRKMQSQSKWRFKS